MWYVQKPRLWTHGGIKTFYEQHPNRTIYKKNRRCRNRIDSGGKQRRLNYFWKCVTNLPCWKTYFALKLSDPGASLLQFSSDTSQFLGHLCRLLPHLINIRDELRFLRNWNFPSVVKFKESKSTDRTKIEKKPTFSIPEELDQLPVSLLVVDHALFGSFELLAIRSLQIVKLLVKYCIAFMNKSKPSSRSAETPLHYPHLYRATQNAKHLRHFRSVDLKNSGNPPEIFFFKILNEIKPVFHREMTSKKSVIQDVSQVLRFLWDDRDLAQQIQ